MTDSNSWDLDLIAQEIPSVEDLPETIAGGLSSIGSASCVSGCVATASTWLP